MTPGCEPRCQPRRCGNLPARVLRRVNFALAVFVLLVLAEPFLLALALRLEQRAADTYAQTALAIVVRCLGLCLVGWALRPSAAARARSLLVPVRPAVLPLWFIGGFGGALLLNQLGLWPFAWRYYRADALAHAGEVAGRPVLLGLWLTSLLVVIPVEEEIFFRLGLLQSLWRRFGAPSLAIVASSLAFGALHLGSPFYQPSATSLRQAVTTTLFGAVLASITVRHHGNLSCAVALHAGRNSADMAVLLLIPT